MAVIDKSQEVNRSWTGLGGRAHHDNEGCLQVVQAIHEPVLLSHKGEHVGVIDAQIQKRGEGLPIMHLEGGCQESHAAHLLGQDRVLYQKVAQMPQGYALVGSEFKLEPREHCQ